MDREQLDREIDQNYDYFRRHLGTFLEREAGRIALIRHCHIVGFFDDAGVADTEARTRFQDGLYSLQPVISEPIDLGYFSHAGGWLSARQASDPSSRSPLCSRR